MKWTTVNHTKVWSSSKEGDVVYMVGLEEGPLLWAPLEEQRINSNRYCSQLDQLKAALDEKHSELVNRKCIIFHQDRPHVSLMTRQKLLLLDWDILFHPLDSPDIAHSDFHLFQSLQNFFNGKVNSLEFTGTGHLGQFFSQNDKKFWEDGIKNLPEK